MGRMRWDHEKMEGFPLEDDDNQTLMSAVDPEWEEITRQQKACGKYEHTDIGKGECALCFARKLR